MPFLPLTHCLPGIMTEWILTPDEVWHEHQADRVAEFHRLHASGCFVMPNPWDVGTAIALEQLGFQALATTSAGLAWTLGRSDNYVTLDEKLDHLRAITGAVDVPINADFEGGFAVDPEEVGANVAAAAATGIAGLSIEDSTKDGTNRFTTSTWPSSGSGPRERRSTRAVQASC